MEYKIVEDGAVFKIKQLDETGNTVGLLDGEFATHEDASAHIISLEGGEAPVESPSEESTGTVSDAEDTATEPTDEPAPGEEGAPEAE